MKFFSIVYYSLMLLQNITILLKTDNIIGLDWREVFWGVWILLSMLAGQVLVLSLLALSNCDILMKRRNYSRKLTLDCKRCLFTSFTLISSTSLLIISINTVISLFRYLDKDVKSKEELLRSCYYLLGWLLSVLFIIMIFSKGLG